ncbi:MAG: hypothetical protein M3Y75_02340 [Actinomycetota bacterium]|nr:hypothetical protein [Actinomycetota bacterium]
MHEVEEVHATPFRVGDFASRGEANDMTAHSLPFHRSALAFPVSVVPTATHQLADVHDTLISSSPPAGNAIIFHSLPFHSSARALWVVDFHESPTATQNVEDAHDTPLNAAWLSLTPTGD